MGKGLDLLPSAGAESPSAGPRGGIRVTCWGVGGGTLTSAQCAAAERLLLNLQVFSFGL